MTTSNALRRLSITLGLKKNARRASLAGSTGALADFLSTTKQEYLKSIHDTADKDANWTVVMGNEADGKLSFF
jgi:chromosome segregation ATPase